MATPLVILVFWAAVLHVGINAKIYSTVVNTEGFVKGGSEKKVHLGLILLMDTYNKDTTCIKVVRVLQTIQKRKVDEFVVNCDGSWSENREVVSYGNDVHIQTEQKKAMRAVFVEEHGCTRRKYTDTGVQQLAKEDESLTQDECDKILHGEESHAKIISMGVGVKGFAKGGSDKATLSGMAIVMNTFKKGSKCVKVLRVIQNKPKRKVDELTVTCDKETWSETDGMVNYGGIVHLKTEEKKAKWAVFVKEEDCVQRIYKDNEELQLVKEDRELTKQECEQVLLDKHPLEDLEEDEEDEEEFSEEDVEDDEENYTPGVISMTDVDTTGYEAKYAVDTLRCRPLGLRVDSQDFYNKDEQCVRLVLITAYGMKVEHMKISCDFDNGRELFGHYQFGHAFTLRPGPSRNKYVGLYNMRDGSCIKRTYTAALRGPKRGVHALERRTADDECKALAKGKNLIDQREILASVNIPPNLRPTMYHPDDGWISRDWSLVIEY